MKKSFSSFQIQSHQQKEPVRQSMPPQESSSQQGITPQEAVREATKIPSLSTQATDTSILSSPFGAMKLSNPFNDSSRSNLLTNASDISHSTSSLHGIATTAPAEKSLAPSNNSFASFSSFPSRRFKQPEPESSDDESDYGFDEEGEEEGEEDILHFSGVKYTTYEEGSEEHHQKILSKVYNEDCEYFANVFKLGLLDTEFQNLFDTLSVRTSNLPDLLQKGILLYQREDRIGAINTFHRCISSTSTEEKHRLIALTWIITVYNSTKPDVKSRHILFKTSSSDRISTLMNMERKRSRSSAGIPMRAQRASADTPGTKAPLPPPLINPKTEHDIATVLMETSQKYNYEIFAYQVAELFRTGRGLPKDFSKALEWYKLALDHGKHRTACLSLGLCYVNGNGCTRSLKTAEKYFRRADRLRDLRASQFLRRCSRMLEYEES